jgi:spore germination protein KC
MISKNKKVFCILLLSSLLTGCWDYTDINKRTIDLGFGIDEANENIEYCGEIAKISSDSFSNKTTVSVSDVYNYRSLGRDFEAARRDYDASVPGEDFSGAMRALVFSEKYAQRKGITSYMNRFYSSPRFRNSVLVVISSEPPREIFRGKIESDITVSYGIEDTIRYLDQNGMALYKTIQQINSDIRFESIGYLIPYITRDNTTIKYLGMAAMKDGKLAGIIRLEESNGFLFVLAKKPFMNYTIRRPNNENNPISVTTTLGKRRIKTSFKDNKVNIDINLKLNSKLEYQYNNINPISKEDIKKMEEIISNKTREEVTSAVKRSQEEFKSDVFGFARYFKADNLEKYKTMNWKEQYLEATVNVNVETSIKNTTLLDPNIKKTH